MPRRNAAGEVHNLINKERHKRGLLHVYWSREMYRLAKNQANYCAKVGRLVHSDRFAFQGGENLCGGKGNFPPKTIVGTWMRIKVILICASIFAIVLGAHGVYVYFSRLELLLGGEASKLFLALEVPVRLQAPIEWMSLKGLQSWFIPAVFIFIGLIIWYWQSNIDVGNVSGWLRKLHLW